MEQNETKSYRRKRIGSLVIQYLVIVLCKLEDVKDWGKWPLD